MTSTVLRIEAIPPAQNSASHRVVFRRPGRDDLSAEFGLSLAISGQQHEDLRWYLEEYAQYPQDPAPRIARQVEGWMAEMGASLFGEVFGSEAGQAVWRALEPELRDTRVELGSVPDAVAWLRMRAPDASTPISLAARSFVFAGADPGTDRGAPAVAAADDAVRVLIVICRPRLGDDVAFRSVAARLLKTAEGLPNRIHLDVLRPPSLDNLRQTLAGAAARGEPYEVVHFDGHGVFEDPFGIGKPRGYLVFENPDSPDNIQFVHGALLGRILKEGGVPILLLNACRSARAEPQAEPERPEDSNGKMRDRTRAYGSLAEEVVKAGIPGVVAMSFNVYVVTAAQFMANLYGCLATGLSLGEAVAAARRRLYDDRRRDILQQPLELEDWVTPVVYENAPIAVCSAPGPTPAASKPQPRAPALQANPGCQTRDRILRHG